MLRLALALVGALGLGACGLVRPEGSATATTTGGDDSSTTDATTGAQGPTVTIATFNVRRFFDTVCQSGKCGPDDYEEAPSEAAFAARSDQIAQAIAELEADVVLLEEIEDQACVDALTARLDGIVSAHIGELGFAASLDTVVLARLPTVAVVSHASETFPRTDGGTTSFTRDLLEVHLDLDGHRVIVFAAHFRSKVDDDPGRREAEGRRAGEIMAIRAAEYPSALIVLGGDLNDTPGSPPLIALAGAAKVLRVASDLEDDATYVFSGVPQAIDHLFLAEDATGGAYVAGSAKVFRTLEQWGWDGWGGSDHAALRASFRVGL
ncbi:MAG: endonuclease/exonuclease/phosphatase family protein [Nannocystaceae bacterium]